MDLAGRYLNSECVVQMLQADQVANSEQTTLLWPLYLFSSMLLQSTAVNILTWLLICIYKYLDLLCWKGIFATMDHIIIFSIIVFKKVVVKCVYWRPFWYDSAGFKKREYMESLAFFQKESTRVSWHYTCKLFCIYLVFVMYEGWSRREDCCLVYKRWWSTQ
jgi:hypothetical protein